MNLKGQQKLSGRPERVWDMLLDPALITSIMPGCKAFEQTGEDQYRGVLEAGVGPLSSRYDTTFTVLDKDYPRSYRLDIEGQGRGGYVSGEVLITLEAQGEATLMRYDGTARVGGAVAQVGRWLVEAVARMIVQQGFGELGKRVEAQLKREGGAPSG